MLSKICRNLRRISGIYAKIFRKFWVKLKTLPRKLTFLRLGGECSNASRSHFSYRSITTRIKFVQLEIVDTHWREVLEKIKGNL